MVVVVVMLVAVVIITVLALGAQMRDSRTWFLKTCTLFYEGIVLIVFPLCFSFLMWTCCFQNGYLCPVSPANKNSSEMSKRSVVLIRMLSLAINHPILF